MSEKTVTKIPEFKGFDFDEEKHLYTRITKPGHL